MMATWEGVSKPIGSSPMFLAGRKPSRDYEDEDRSHHPRRPNNRDLVRDHALESGRKCHLDDGYFQVQPRASVGSICGLEESMSSMSTYGRESCSSAFDDAAYVGRRGSLSSDSAEIAMARKTIGDNSARNGDGQTGRWCNFCSNTGHATTDCPWHPNSSSPAVNWLDGRKLPESEWSGVDFRDEKNLYQDEAAAEFDPDKDFFLVDTPRHSTSEHPPNFMSPNLPHNYLERSWEKASVRPTRNNNIYHERNNIIHERRDDVHHEPSGWISVDPSKSGDKAFDEDGIARLQIESAKLFNRTPPSDVGSAYRALSHSMFNEAQQFGHEDFEEPLGMHSELCDSVEMGHTEDMSVDASMRSSFDGFDGDSSGRGMDGRRHHRGSLSRSSDFSGSGHTRSGSVTVIAPSVITLMHPRVPSKAVNSPVKPVRVEHRRSASQGFAPSYLPSSPPQKPQQDFMKPSFGADVHRIVEPTKKQCVDETVGVVPPVIGKRCHKCWGYGHLHAQCPSRNGGANAKNNRDGSWKQCRFCRERGHVFSDCPHLPSAAQANTAQANTHATLGSPSSLPASPPARFRPGSPPLAQHL